MIALPERGAWSDYVVCRAEYCFNIPAEMNYHDAIALTTNGIIAYTLLFELGGLRPGKSVLMHSAPGGLVSIQFTLFAFLSLKNYFLFPNNKGKYDSANV